jgi:regulator of sigma E protease
MWTALKLGLRVEAFAIGFGPKLWSKVYKGVEYSFRLIPLGGFVRIPDLVHQSAVEGDAKDRKPIEIPTLHRIAVLAAGPIMNLVFAFAIASLLYVVGYPAPADTAEIAGITPKSAAALAGVHNGDIIQTVEGHKVADWHDVLTSVALAKTNQLQLTALRGTNVVSYTVGTITDKDFQCKMLPFYPPSKLLIKDFAPNSPAVKAGLQKNDEIVMVNKQPVSNVAEFREAIRITTNGLAASTQEPPILLTYRRDDTLASINLTPVDQRIGVMLSEVDERTKIVHITPWAQFAEVFTITYQSFDALAHSSQSQVGLKDLSGPPGIISVIALNSSEDIRLALKFLVLFNINLAIINLMPLPILDGGHILLALITALTGRKVPEKLLNYVFNSFACLLLGFMVYVSWNDMKRFHWLDWIKAQFTSAPTVPHSATSPTPEAVQNAFTQINHATITVGLIFVCVVLLTFWFSLRRSKASKED